MSGCEEERISTSFCGSSLPFMLMDLDAGKRQRFAFQLFIRLNNCVGEEGVAKIFA